MGTGLRDHYWNAHRAFEVPCSTDDVRRSKSIWAHISLRMLFYILLSFICSWDSTPKQTNFINCESASTVGDFKERRSRSWLTMVHRVIYPLWFGVTTEAIGLDFLFPSFETSASFHRSWLCWLEDERCLSLCNNFQYNDNFTDTYLSKASIILYVFF